MRRDTLRHRISQWSIVKLTEVLNSKPLRMVEVSEAYTSSIDPFTGNRIPKFTPSMTSVAVRGGRLEIAEIQLRLAGLGNGLVLDRDVIGAINIGLRYLSSDGSPMALGSTELHEIRVKLMNPYQGLTPLTKLKILKTN